MWLVISFSYDFPLVGTDKVWNFQIKFFKIWKLWLMMSFFCNFPLMGTLKYENCGLWWFSPVIFLWWELTKYGIFKSNSSLKIWKLWLMMSFSCDFPLMETDKILNTQIKFFKNMKIVACHDFLLWFSFDGNFKIWKLWLMMIFFCNFSLMGTLKYENCGLSGVSSVIFLWWEL